METRILKKYLLITFFIFIPYPSFGQQDQQPKNAHLNYWGTGWECDRGYVAQGNECVPVSIPENAQLDYFGHGWECKRGYYWNRNQCLSVELPENAELDYFGHGWQCKRGYYADKNRCLTVEIPQNAKLNYFGNGWECDRGYYQSGNDCLRVGIPENAKLDYSGHGWQCNDGFKNLEGKCASMTKDEIAAQAEMKQKLLLMTIAKGSSNPDCDKAYDACESECSGAIYDYDSGDYLYNTDFKRKCENACSSGVDVCEDEPPSERCDEFYDDCESDCPSSVYDYDSGKYLYNTNGKRKCEDACEAGKDDCES